MSIERDVPNDLTSIPWQRWKKQFQLTVDRALGDRIRADEAAAIEMWSSLANIDWVGPEGAKVSYSFREAGGLVAWVREEGDYIDWYCSGPFGVVSAWIEEGLAKEGWSWVAAGSTDPE